MGTVGKPSVFGEAFPSSVSESAFCADFHNASRDAFVFAKRGCDAQTGSLDSGEALRVRSGDAPRKRIHRPDCPTPQGVRRVAPTMEGTVLRRGKAALTFEIRAAGRQQVRRRRWPSTRRCQRTQCSFAAFRQKSRKSTVSSFNRSERPPWNGRVNQNATAFEVLQPPVERRLLTLPDRTDLRHWFASIRDGDGLSFAHLSNDLGKPRFCFVD